MKFLPESAWRSHFQNNGITSADAVESKFIRLAFADEGGGAKRRHFLGSFANDHSAGGSGQFGKFLQ